MTKYITYNIDNDGICTLKINRPPVNALSYDLLNDLSLTVSLLDCDEKVKCLIICTDNKHFSAGADLKERKIMSKNDATDALDNFNLCFNTIESFENPVICAINGFCLGGGAELALSCDIRIGSEDSIVGFPEVTIGIIPGAGGTQRLPKTIGLSNSKYWILSGKKFNSTEAIDYGFFNFVKSKDELLDFSIEIAKQIIVNAPIAIKSAKSAINEGTEISNINKKLELERMYYNTCLDSEDRLEALDAFYNKRKPKWENK